MMRRGCCSSREKTGSNLKTIGSIFNSVLFLLKECNSVYLEYIPHLYPVEEKKVEEMPSEVRNEYYSLKNFAKLICSENFKLYSWIIHLESFKIWNLYKNSQNTTVMGNSL